MDYDIVIRGGLIVDGTGSEPVAGDLAIKDGRIAAIGKVSGAAAREIDASGLGVLILLQKRARERGLRTRLLNVPGTVERLLDATRLEPLFEVVRL